MILCTVDKFLSLSKASLSAHMNRAKPEGKITEVVDDMLDAVAGAEPLVCQVPSNNFQR